MVPGHPRGVDREWWGCSWGEGQLVWSKRWIHLPDKLGRMWNTQRGHNIHICVCFWVKGNDGEIGSSKRGRGYWSHTCLEVNTVKDERCVCGEMECLQGEPATVSAQGLRVPSVCLLSAQSHLLSLWPAPDRQADRQASGRQAGRQKSSVCCAKCQTYYQT